MKKKILITIGIAIGVLILAIVAFLVYTIKFVDYKFTDKQLISEVNNYRVSKNIPVLSLDSRLCKNINILFTSAAKADKVNETFSKWVKDESLGNMLIGELWIKDISQPYFALDYWLKNPSDKMVLEKSELNRYCAYANNGTAVVVIAQSK